MKMNCILSLFKNEGESIENIECYINDDFMKELTKLIAKKEKILENLGKLMEKYKFYKLDGEALDITVDDIAGINLPQS